MKLWKIIAKKAFNWSLNYIYNYIDADKDGKISKTEIKDFHTKLKKLLDLVKKKK